MTPNEQKMWYDIAQAIEPYCVNAAGFILERHETDIPGFYMENHNPGRLTIGVIGSHEDVLELPIEDDIRLYVLGKQSEGKGYYDPKTMNWVDAPGTFEGIPDGPE